MLLVALRLSGKHCGSRERIVFVFSGLDVVDSGMLLPLPCSAIPPFLPLFRQALSSLPFPTALVEDCAFTAARNHCFCLLGQWGYAATPPHINRIGLKSQDMRWKSVGMVNERADVHVEVETTVLDLAEEAVWLMKGLGV